MRMIRIKVVEKKDVGTYFVKETLKSMGMKWDNDTKYWAFDTEKLEEAKKMGEKIIDMGFGISVLGHKWSQKNNQEYSFWNYPNELEREENYQNIKNLDKELYFYEKNKLGILR